MIKILALHFFVNGHQRMEGTNTKEKVKEVLEVAILGSVNGRDRKGKFVPNI